MSEIYKFYGKDITMNICIQIRAVLNILKKKLDIDFIEAIDLFYNSNTYKILQNTENCLWAESAEYIADRYFEEGDNRPVRKRFFVRDFQGWQL